MTLRPFNGEKPLAPRRLSPRFAISGHATSLTFKQPDGWIAVSRNLVLLLHSW